MSYMFYNCSSLASLDVSGLDTSNVTGMSYMFCNCSSLASLDVSGLDTSNVTDMGGMFSGCSSLSLPRPLLLRHLQRNIYVFLCI